MLRQAGQPAWLANIKFFEKGPEREFLLTNYCRVTNALMEVTIEINILRATAEDLMPGGARSNLRDLARWAASE
jgi:hypothetical protein